jgi:pimeloyl-ACP methyl ester carboxylesterase
MFPIRCNMLISKNDIVKGEHGKPILLDFGYKTDGKPKPVVIFVHGFKGFKDWGHFNEVMEYFIEQDFAFVKFNFSHNGGTIEQPIDFPDLEAFGNNNYTKELDDLKTVVDWIEDQEKSEFDKDEIYLIGHSRGGGVSILAANEDKRIKKLVTWAAVADLINRYPQEVIDQWEKEGVMYIENTRTNQQMPLYYQLAEDVLGNMDRFNIALAANKLAVPHLIIHGTSDEVVHIAEAKNIHEWSKSSEILIIEGSGHTFGAKHPHVETYFPEDVQLVLEKTLEFIKK